MADDDLNRRQWAKWWNQCGSHELGQLLYWRWDPIGVSESFPWARDEYDSYATEIASMLLKGKDPKAIARFLAKIERDRMKLEADEAQLLEIAGVIHEWYPESIARWQEFGP